MESGFAFYSGVSTECAQLNGDIFPEHHLFRIPRFTLKRYCIDCAVSLGDRIRRILWLSMYLRKRPAAAVILAIYYGRCGTAFGPARN